MTDMWHQYVVIKYRLHQYLCCKQYTMETQSIAKKFVYQRKLKDILKKNYRKQVTIRQYSGLRMEMWILSSNYQIISYGVRCRNRRFTDNRNPKEEIIQKMVNLITRNTLLDLLFHYKFTLCLFGFIKRW
jgi:hypothetical protein